jgi:hypothetical protein
LQAILLESTLMDMLGSVDSKPLILPLSPLDATLTENGGLCGQYRPGRSLTELDLAYF